MNINTNVNPYYDDFDEFKNFHQILFKPGFAVQARELTQIQSILQDQIKKFGNHIFRHGSVVIPGNSTSDLSSQYVKLQTVNPNLTLADIEGKVVVGATTQLRASVRKFVPATSTEPATIYVNYLRGGTAVVFADSETLTIENTTNTLLTATSESTGVGSLAFVNTGVFYINGNFVTVSKQSAVLSKYTTLPSAHVVLKIVESIVTIDDDESLLDPAQGSYNYSAPGADRYKINLVLDTIPYGSALTDDLVELMRYNNGVLEEHIRYPKYNELEKNLARRTYDESGDYVVNGLDTSIREHKKIDVNGGLDVSGSVDKFVATISSGKAYIGGFENEKISDTNLILDKGRTADHIKTKGVVIQPNFGQYIYVTGPAAAGPTGALPFYTNLQSVEVYDAATGGNLIGSMQVTAMDFHEGDYTSWSVFKVYFNNLTLNVGKTPESIGRIQYTYGSATTYALRVLHKLTVPGTNKDFQSNEIITNNQTDPKKATVYHWVSSTSTLYVSKHSSSLQVPLLGNSIYGESSQATGGNVSQKNVVTTSDRNAQVFELPVDTVNKVKNSSNISDISYKVYKNVVITVSTSTGSDSVTIDSGLIDSPLDYFNSFFIGPNGIIPFGSNTIVASSGNTITVTNTGLPVGSKIHGVVSVTKTLSQKTKTKIVKPNETVSLISGVGTLMNSDIYKINSIKDGGVDVTSKFTLDNGQRDYAYLQGKITLKAGQTASSSVVVEYEYFQHSSGDYLTADSYTTLGSSYLTLIPTYVSNSDSSIYDLRNCIDFRQTQTSSVFSLGDIVQPQSFITTSVQYFVPRIDLVFMAKGGRIGVVTGDPSDTPTQGKLPIGTIGLSTLYIPAYTKNVTDIVVKTIKNKVFTMEAVGKLEDRIYNLEQYTLLSQTENALVNYDVIDSNTGKSRYKSGYLVETFNNPEAISDVFSSEFKAFYKNGMLYPRSENIDVEMLLSTSESTDYANTNGMITLPYTNTVMTSQGLSTRVTNINPFAVVSWKGNMRLNPSVDNYVDYEYLPAIFENITVQEVSLRRDWRTWSPLQLAIMVTSGHVVNGLVSLNQTGSKG